MEYRKIWEEFREAHRDPQDDLIEPTHGLLPEVAATGGVDVEEIKADNARTQREYQAEYNWQVGGCQTSPPSGIDLFRRD